MLTVNMFIMTGCAVTGIIATLKAVVDMTLLSYWCYNGTIGATAYTILCETGTSRL